MDLWFRDERLRQHCRDRELMRRRWGDAGARTLARRLQQLVAMATIDDLDFLPFAWRAVGDEVIEIDLTEDLVLVLVLDEEPSGQGDTQMHHLTVTDVAVPAQRGAPAR